VAAQIKPLATFGGLPNDARVNHKPHHKRPGPYSERNQVMYLAGFLLVIVLALLAVYLWWTNSPLHGSQ
jgi:hypothetical protein